jgi:hypothetical protein
MVDDCSEKVIEPAIEQAFPISASIITPALGAVIEVLEKIAADLTTQK